MFRTLFLNSLQTSCSKIYHSSFIPTTRVLNVQIYCVYRDPTGDVDIRFQTNPNGPTTGTFHSSKVLPLKTLTENISIQRRLEKLLKEVPQTSLFVPQTLSVVLFFFTSLYLVLKIFPLTFFFFYFLCHVAFLILRSVGQKDFLTAFN